MTEDPLVNFGKKVKKERLKKNLSQEKLAARAGVHRTYIGMIERAEKNITLRNIVKIAKALDLKIIDLFKEQRVYETKNSKATTIARSKNI